MEVLIGILTIASLAGILIYIIISDRRFIREFQKPRSKKPKGQVEE